MAQNERGYLMPRRWIENVERAITPKPNAPESTRRTSLFYDVRPARIKSDWATAASGVWTATANFVIRGADGNATLDESFPFNVVQYASEQPTTIDASQTVYVVWRGRWELVTAPSDAVEPFVYEYVEKQGTGRYSRAFGSADEFVKKRSAAHITGTTFYNRNYASRDELLNAKITLELCFDDWEGEETNGYVYPDSHRYNRVKTPVITDVRPTILSAAVYDADDRYTELYRDGATTSPPLCGRACLPYPITIRSVGGYFSAYRDDRNLSPFYTCFDKNDETGTVVILDHPARHFETLADVPAVFFRDEPSTGYAAQLYCPTILVPRNFVRAMNFDVGETTETSVYVIPITRPFKHGRYSKYDNRRFSLTKNADGTYGIGSNGVLLALGGVPVGGRGGGKWDDPETPTNATATVQNNTLYLSWTATNQNVVVEYFVNGESRARNETSETWTALSYYGAGTATITGVNVAGVRSEPATVDVPAI